MAAKISWHEKNYVSVSLYILRNDLMLYMQTHDRLCSLYLAGSIWRWGIFWLRRSTRKLEAPRARSSTAEAAKTAVCDDRRGIARFSKSRVCVNVWEESTVISGLLKDTQISSKYSAGLAEGSHHANNQLDTSSGSYTVPACDGRTDRHGQTQGHSYSTALALRRAIE